MSRANPKENYRTAIGKAASYTIKREESGSMFYSTAASVVFSLPDSNADPNVVGCTAFVSMGGFANSIAPSGTDVIRYKGVALTQPIRLANANDLVEVTCGAAGEWSVTSYMGKPAFGYGSPQMPWDIVYTSVDLTLDWTHHGKTIVVISGGPSDPVITLPSCANANDFWVRIAQWTRTFEVHADGSDVFRIMKVATAPSQIKPEGRGTANTFVELLGNAAGAAWGVCGGDGVWLDTGSPPATRFVLGGHVTDATLPNGLASITDEGQLQQEELTLDEVLARDAIVVKTLNMISDEDMSGSPPGSPNVGDAYVVNNWGGAHTDGDVKVYAAGAWTKVAALSDPPGEGLRVVVNGTEPGGTVGGSFFGYEKQVMEYNATDAKWGMLASMNPGYDARLVLVVSDPVYKGPGLGGQFFVYSYGTTGTSTKFVPVGYVSGSVESNFVAFDALGLPKDSGSKAGDFATKLHWVSQFIPVGQMVAGNTPPEDATFSKPGATPTGKVQVRKFDPTTEEDMFVPFEVPYQWNSKFYYQVVGYITESTVPVSGEGVSFKLAGFSVGQGESIQGTLGTAIESALADLYAEGADTQGDRFITPISTEVGVSGIKTGELAMFKLVRAVSESEDDYAQDVGVSGIMLYYQVNTMASPV